jgi:hypothetical protein
MKKTILKFFDGVRAGILIEPFTIKEAAQATGLPWAGNFLAKHRKGNPGRETALFERVSGSPVRYRICRK